MEDQVIDNISITMKIDFEDTETTKRIYDSLILESKYDPNERAKATIKTDNTTLILTIVAKDTVSARAASNSFLKWIHLSEQLLDYVDNAEES